MKKYGIIVVGYNRTHSIKRLLDALDRADYKNETVTLIISIDNSGSDDVEKLAQSFEWKYGNKIVKTYSERQGLRKHILRCGDYIEEYQLDAAAIFEDDIYPSPAFFNYMRQAVEYYCDDMDIAGISLYTHLWNVNASLPFQPAYNGYDNFFLCYAQSWGQIWLKNQWIEFKKWYEQNSGRLSLCNGIPQYVLKWPETSWLKYHIAYCVEKKKYFVYPYESLATCFAEAGEHTVDHISLYNVPLMSNADRIYSFDNLTNASVKYNVFFEREGLGKYLDLPEDELCVDLYGCRSDCMNYKYLITYKVLPYKLVDSYAMEMRPHEDNIVHGIKGKKIFLYDLSQKDGNEEKNALKIEMLSYYFRLNKSGKWLVQYAIGQKLEIMKKTGIFRKIFSR